MLEQKANELLTLFTTDLGVTQPMQILMSQKGMMVQLIFKFQMVDIC